MLVPPTLPYSKSLMKQPEKHPNRGYWGSAAMDPTCAAPGLWLSGREVCGRLGDEFDQAAW